MLESQLESFKKQSHFIVAYEPVWAIGSGVSADRSQVEEAVGIIRQTITNDSVPILYGGSVQAHQIKELAQIQGIGGFLVGKSSLDLNEFISIYTNCLKA